MKKIHITSSLLMILIFLATAHGFVEKRHQWWEVRLQNLANEKNRFQKNINVDRQVLVIIENEMNRARDIIAVFESEMRDDGSLTHETRTMTDTDIASEARNIVPPLFALHQLEALVNEPWSGLAASEAREAAEQRVNRMVQAFFGEKSPDLVRRILESDISREEWKSLAFEYYIGRMMTSRKSMEDHAVSDIAARVSLALKARNNITNSRELRALTVRLTGEYLSECGTHGFPHDGAALEASWNWKRKETALTRDFNACKKIIALAKSLGRMPGAVSLERIMFYHKNPGDLESLLFRDQRPGQGESMVPAKDAGKRTPGAVIMEVPAPLPRNSIMDDIDNVRRGTISAITGREDERFFTGIGKSIAAIINRHSAGIKIRYFREEERARLLRKKEGERLKIANEKEFLEAKKKFQSDLALVDDYGKKSMECIAIVCEGKKIISGSIVDQYRYRVKRDEEYLRFASSLVAESSRLWAVEDTRVSKEFSLSMSKIGSLFTFIGEGLALNKSDQIHLTKGDMGTIRDIKTRFIGTTGSLRSDIGRSRDQYAMKRSSSAGASQKKRATLKETIAQDEIDGLFRHAVECVELYEQYQYGEKALYRYADQYKAFLKEARTGTPSETLAYSLKMNSLLTSFDQFDGARIARELTTKQYLQKETKASLARLIILLEFYKKNGVTFKDPPLPAEMAALVKRVSIVHQVRIDAWVMNESNYKEIDKKAARKILLILNRRELLTVSNNHRDGNKQIESMMISIKEPELSLALPRGWEEDTIGEAETYLGIVKAFHSGDGNSSLRLVKLTLEKGDMKDTAEGWIEKSGCSLVEKRWEKAGDVDCLWILARDRHRNIFETCSISKDGYAVLISGKTTRDRYSVFKVQFKKIINSLRMETL